MNSDNLQAKVVGIAFILVVSTFLVLPLWAKDTKTVAVLPFAIHSSENIEYVQQGIWDMLISRISAAEKIEVIPKEKVIAALQTVKGKELTLADVYGIGRTLGAEHVVWGSITKIGNSVSIDAKLVDIAAYKTTVGIFTQSQGMDDIIVKINDFAQRIDAHLLGRTPPPSPAAAPKDEKLERAPSAPMPTSREGEIVSALRKGKKGTLTAGINPDFLSGGTPMDKRGFWMSQRYPTEFRGLDIGDVDGDGKNEIVAIDINSVYIFRKKDNDLILLQKITGNRSDNFVGVDVVDIVGDTAKEIIVSNIVANRTTTAIFNNVHSFIVEYREGKFVVTQKDLPWVFRAITRPEGTLLLGQRVASFGGTTRPFDTPICEMVVRSG
ncbi:MAG: hypothetical protein N2Z74_09785, partial [Syntrophales bacterium]|nr:hypothetical protein [Syntrophales bacterium]